MRGPPPHPRQESAPLVHIFGLTSQEYNYGPLPAEQKFRENTVWRFQIFVLSFEAFNAALEEEKITTLKKGQALACTTDKTKPLVTCKYASLSAKRCWFLCSGSLAGYQKLSTCLGWPVKKNIAQIDHIHNACCVVHVFRGASKW